MDQLDREWLEADGCGGFASGTVAGMRTRRYHGLLLAARTPPTDRVMLVNGFEAELVTPSGRYPITTQHYAPDVIHPNGRNFIEAFSAEPWPRWRLRFPDGSELSQELFAVHGAPQVVLRWQLTAANPAGYRLELRPLLSGRDYHATHHENPALNFAAEGGGERLRFQSYASLPAIESIANARFEAAPLWYRNFSYRQEQLRGLDALEDLASPGVLHFDLQSGPALWILAAGLPGAAPLPQLSAAELAQRLAAQERTRRMRFASERERAADAYLVRRGDGLTLIAGYPWFTDWGRDTFIALRGLCLATGRVDEAQAILRQWSGAVSRGMLPNRFPDAGELPEYNSVDASLWFIVAVHELFAARPDAAEAQRAPLRAACEAILDGYSAGTRHGIRLDADGLLAAGAPGQQLTWMDAKIGDHVVTPRCGKPVEVQALFINALAIAGNWAPRFREPHARALAAFERRFWNEASGTLYDVVDCDHVPGALDASLRPNQVLAAGGLPFMVLSRERARRMLDVVEARLLTPLGLRTLAPDEPGYTPRYEGGPRERDAAYHQGTVWPWLLGPFVEAWLRVRGAGAAARAEARARFLAPLIAQAERGFGHVCEISDAEPPQRALGCPFQAWSVGELLRLERGALAPESSQPIAASDAEPVRLHPTGQAL